MRTRQWHWEYQAGATIYEEERAAQSWANWLNGEGLDRLRSLAEEEEKDEKATGVMTSNVYRHSLTKAEARRPVVVRRRKVTDWESL